MANYDNLILKIDNTWLITTIPWAK